MKKKTSLHLFLVAFCVSITLIAGCYHDEDDESFDELIEEELGAYSFGPLIDYGELMYIQFEYDGEPIRIPYYVEGWAEGIVSELGWLMFIDGIPQPTHLETLEGDIFRESAYMHHFDLAYREREEFYVVFTPISGEIGESIGLIAGAMLKPNFMPLNIADPIFFPFHNIITTFPYEVEINSQTKGSFVADIDVELKSIPQNILADEQHRMEGGVDFEQWLAAWSRIGMIPTGTEIQLNYEGVIRAEDGEINLSLFVYGGEEIRSRITFFVNHQPVQINGGADFIEVQIQDGQMALIDVELSLADLEDFNAIYAMMMATGADYHAQDIFKVRTLLLVNE